MNRKKFFYSLILLFFYSFILSGSISAAGEFIADYEVKYSVSPIGITTVTNSISLTNKLTSLYPKQYTVLIDSDKIQNVIAYDKKGSITPAVNRKNEKTEITVPFNERAVGIGNTLTFTLRYDNGDIAQKNGNIWELYIPGIADDPDLGMYKVSLSVPSSFGPNAYMTPMPASGMYWTKEQLTRGGVSAAYGEFQQFLFTLSYHLDNTTLQPKISEITLPPDTAYQNITINSLSPQPLSIKGSEDGNWVASYQVPARSSLDIEALLRVNVSAFPDDRFIPTKVQTEKYLAPLPFWETKDPKIVSLAQRYRTPREIYDYVVGALSYDYRKVTENPTRAGAIGALNSPRTAICTEFTDLFIAIARAGGIPARRAVGFAYTTNAKLRPLSLVADILHAWPEYYDAERNLWIPVDPTWADTTGGVNYFDNLDFNHVVFAYNGLSSQLPLPVGFYRNVKKLGKDIDMAFPTVASKETLTKTPVFTTSIQFPQTITSGFPARGMVAVTNTSGVTQRNILLGVVSVPPGVNTKQQEQIILPFDTIQIPLALRLGNYVTTGRGTISVNVNGALSTAYFQIQPAYMLLIPALVVVVIVAIGMLWFIKKS